MKTFLAFHNGATGHQSFTLHNIPFQPGMILFFGNRRKHTGSSLLRTLRNAFRDAILTGCPTSREFSESNFVDHSVSLTAIITKKQTLHTRKQI